MNSNYFLKTHSEVAHIKLEETIEEKMRAETERKKFRELGHRIAKQKSIGS